jgi:hypothetical protein
MNFSFNHAFDLRNLLSSTALDPLYMKRTVRHLMYYNQCILEYINVKMILLLGIRMIFTWEKESDGEIYTISVILMFAFSFNLSIFIPYSLTNLF